MKHLDTGSFLFTIVFGKIKHPLLNLVSDVIRGSIPIPIAQVMTNQRARSGSCQTLPFAHYAIGKCLIDGAIPKSWGKNIVGSGIGIGVISRPTRATRLGRESESTSRLVSGAILFEKSMILSWLGIFSIDKFSRLCPTKT